MTRMEAFNLAKAEIKTYGFPVKRASLELSEKPPEGVFYSLFQNPKTGEMLCRTYMYDKEEKTVSFIQVLNPIALGLRNPALVRAYLENGNFIYRNALTQTKVDPKEENGIISLFSTKLLKIPI